MVDCKLCGQEVACWGNYGADYNAILDHAEMYHFEVFDSFPPEKVRGFILDGDPNNELDNDDGGASGDE